LLQGHATRARNAIASSIGQAKRSRTGTKDAVDRPLLSQMTISLSLYMRERVAMMEMNRLNASTVVSWLTMLKPMIKRTSEGLTEPRLACPRVRMSMMVMTMVMMTTTVAMKFLARSLRSEESNNIEQKQDDADDEI